jgi:hypothetical protein
MQNELLSGVYAAIDALLKASCVYEETDTPELSAAINRAIRAKGTVRALMEQNAAKG